MLHSRSDIDDIENSLTRLSKEIGRFEFPSEATDRRMVKEIIEREIELDGNAHQNLATFCSTWESDEVKELMTASINKNLIDKDEYPMAAEIERRCVHMLADLWNAPDSHDAVGTSAIGSSEACMLAGMAMHRRWRNRRRAEGKATDAPNLVCGPVQVVWHKFARYWDIELREVGMAPGRLGLDPESVLGQVDENTIGVVPTLGVTYTGIYEPVADIAAALDDLQARTGLDIDIHVDGASGGFTAPFCAPDLVWDFRLPRVKSISSSGHKFGLAPLGVGWVLFRDGSELPDELVFHVTYLGGDMPTFQINFSRPAGQIIAQYAGFLRLGREGYAAVHGQSYATAHHLAQHLPAVGPFELLYDGDPAAGIPAATWKLADDADVTWTLYELADRLRTRGWQVPAYPLTGELSGQVVQRALIRIEITTDEINSLITDMKEAVDFLERHPVTVQMSQDEGTSFSH
ncbi:MAG TPA: glutamate decarboxylase [Microthrixaceae bacterium]|nr:glutamate decarboxylase [Microthrixaceae bacterium]